ncbi:MAG: class II fructose-bisphosphate aldolase [Clostridia bacterium]|nr:class II fructose-bisphosphate aldolase [Clostridia bacterium]
MYTTMIPMMVQAKKDKKGVPAFNIHALEVVPMMARTAEGKGSPVILQVSVSTAKYIGFQLLADIVREVAEPMEIPVALHLDHASSLDDIEAALAGGFSSVMYDGSRLPLDENIQNTKRAVALARAANASIEAELGIVGRGKIIEAYPYTDPADAKEFVAETGVDALAVGIGTHHGQYKAKTEIRLDILDQIHQAVDIPLVLHGGTGVKEEDVKTCVRLGMLKLNFGTELNVSWVNRAKRVFAEAEPDDSLRELMLLCNAAMAETIARKIDLVRDV